METLVAAQLLIVKVVEARLHVMHPVRLLELMAALRIDHEAQ